MRSLYTTTSITMLLLQEDVIFRYFVQDSSVIIGVLEESFIDDGMVTVSSNCICLCISVCPCVTLCVFLCPYVCLHVCVFVFMYICPHVFVCVCLSVPMSVVCTYMLVHLFVII